MDKVDIYGVTWHNSWFLNPDEYIDLNIFETTNTTRKSKVAIFWSFHKLGFWPLALFA